MFAAGFAKIAKVFVYRNIRKSKDAHTYSVKGEDGRVKQHTQSLSLINPEVKVSKKGMERVRTEGVKNVHAGIKGDIAEINQDKYSWREITYDPKKYETFIFRDTKLPVEKPDAILLTPKGAVAGFQKVAASRISKIIAKSLGYKSPKAASGQISEVSKMFKNKESWNVLKPSIISGFKSAKTITPTRTKLYVDAITNSRSQLKSKTLQKAKESVVSNKTKMQRIKKDPAEQFKMLQEKKRLKEVKNHNKSIEPKIISLQKKIEKLKTKIK
jgi:hypothetical protein